MYRSLNVPGSPSSALTTRYFGLGLSLGMKDHFLAAGNPAPPRPRRFAFPTSSMIAAGVIESAFLAAVVASVLDVGVEPGSLRVLEPRREYRPVGGDERFGLARLTPKQGIERPPDREARRTARRAAPSERSRRRRGTRLRSASALRPESFPPDGFSSAFRSPAARRSPPAAGREGSCRLEARAGRRERCGTSCRTKRLRAHGRPSFPRDRPPSAPPRARCGRSSPGRATEEAASPPVAGRSAG